MVARLRTCLLLFLYYSIHQFYYYLLVKRFSIDICEVYLPFLDRSILKVIGSSNLLQRMKKLHTEVLPDLDNKSRAFGNFGKKKGKFGTSPNMS